MKYMYENQKLCVTILYIKSAVCGHCHERLAPLCGHFYIPGPRKAHFRYRIGTKDVQYGGTEEGTVEGRTSTGGTSYIQKKHNLEVQWKHAPVREVHIRYKESTI